MEKFYTALSSERIAQKYERITPYSRIIGEERYNSLSGDISAERRYIFVNGDIFL